LYIFEQVLRDLKIIGILVILLCLPDKRLVFLDQTLRLDLHNVEVTILLNFTLIFLANEPNILQQLKFQSQRLQFGDYCCLEVEVALQLVEMLQLFR
jgi:hypothetical protein